MCAASDRRSVGSSLICGVLLFVYNIAVSPWWLS
jgi:hypothetical protein